MNRRLRMALAVTAAIGISAGAAGTASAATEKLTIKGKFVFRAGKGVRDNQRFVQRNLKVKSGDTVNVINRSKEPDPHSLTFVEKAFLPTGFESAAAMLAGGAHAPNGDQPPFFAKIDDGAPAADQAAPLAVNTLGTDTTVGDSEFLAPGQKSTSFTVTAAAGSKLYYFCFIHPWMQGKISVQ
jgi:plastocyanin